MCRPLKARRLGAPIDLVDSAEPFAFLVTRRVFAFSGAMQSDVERLELCEQRLALCPRCARATKAVNGRIESGRVARGAIHVTVNLEGVIHVRVRTQAR